MKISVVSGGFDPIHSGHISYLKSAKEISDYLIVALNSDNWLVNKKKRVFMSLEERKSQEICHESQVLIDQTALFFLQQNRVSDL